MASCGICPSSLPKSHDGLKIYASNNEAVKCLVVHCIAEHPVGKWKQNVSLFQRVGLE